MPRLPQERFQRWEDFLADFFLDLNEDAKHALALGPKEAGLKR
jgi:hypothetical protein